jgi:hypothetical protein
MCLNETYSTVCIGKYQSQKFLFRMAWNREMLYLHRVSTLLWNKPLGGSKRNRKGWNWMGHTSFWPMLMLI